MLPRKEAPTLNLNHSYVPIFGHQCFFPPSPGMGASYYTRVVGSIATVVTVVAVTHLGVGEFDFSKFDGGPLPRTYNLSGSIYYAPKPNAWNKRQVVFELLEESHYWPRAARNKKRMTIFEPVIHSTDEDRVGRLGDGGKWVAHLKSLDKRPCVVYSFGSNGDTSFEEDVDFLTQKRCEIHTFDPDPRFSRIWRGSPSNVHYHSWAIDTGEYSLRNIAYSLGHIKSGIDVLKIDIEGSEYRVLHQAVGTVPIGQLLVEAHEIGRSDAWRTFELIKMLERNGLYHFHSEVNPYDAKACKELSFLNVTYQFH